MSEHLDRHVIRGLAREHFLDEWQADGWQVDQMRGEVCVGDSWFPVESLPRILSNHMKHLRELEQEVKAPQPVRCVTTGCANNLPCGIHCSSCGGNRVDSPPCQRNPETGEGGHTWSDGLPYAAAPTPPQGAGQREGRQG